ncbi:MAG: penicillin-binding protein 2 [Bacilli bacterium]|nr:penicillin-binding protein 2 [Bacilli bacterium]
MNIKKLQNKRIIIIYIILFLLFSLLIYKIIDIQIIKNEHYKNSLDELTIKMVESNSTPRGRIFDRNYNLLVDNIGVRTIYFKREKEYDSKKLIKSIRLIKDHINLNYDLVSEDNLKDYYMFINDKEDLITKEEKKKLEERKITNKELNELIRSRITLEELNNIDKREAYLYYLVNNGYYYEEKLIKRDASEEEYAFVASNISKLNGFNVKIEWERKYIYGDTFRNILGNISINGIPKELKDEYLSKGYKLNDIVGISNLEYQYEDYLKGEKAKYKLNDDNSYKLVKDGIRGKDIVLTIDINLQKEVENIITQEMINAKNNDLNTSLYDGSKVIITDPNTGEILAFASKEMINNNIYDNTTSLVTGVVTPGSIVKGASISTGYKYGAIDIGDVMLDECIKIKNKPSKCSWKKGIGYINDIEALMISSNSYQFKTAIKVSGEPYEYNKELNISKETFDKYRSMFNEYGLGVKTGIDLPIESTGNIGDKYDSDMLLDFVIGQYDTYTPVQIANYISTIASYGNRYKLHFLKEVRNSSDTDELGDIYLENKPILLNKVSLDDKYINRVRLGFNKVMLSLGYGYMGDIPDPSGKTGTSNSFKDTDGDGIIDRETISKAFIGYAPSDNPRFSLVVLSPHVSDLTYGEYVSGVNYRISERVSNKMFDFLQ